MSCGGSKLGGTGGCGCGGAKAKSPTEPHVCGRPGCVRCATTARPVGSAPTLPRAVAPVGRSRLCGTPEVHPGVAVALEPLVLGLEAEAHSEPPDVLAPRRRGPHPLLDALATEREFGAQFRQVLRGWAASPGRPGAPLVGAGATIDPTRPCGIARSVSYRDVASLAGACRISLGPCDTFGAGAVLEASVPEGFRPSSSLDDTLRDFAPDWWARTYGRRGRMGSMRRMLLGGGRASSLWWPGLCWNDPYREAMALALATIRGFADVVDELPGHIRADCGYSAASVVARFAVGDFRVLLLDCSGGLPCLVKADLHSATMSVDRDGLVEAAMDFDGVYAFTADPRWALFALLGVRFPPTITLFSGKALQASLADYYFWWARRLHSRVLEGDGTWMDAFVGMLCARCAIAEVTDIAELVFHEMGHLFPGGPYHCATPFIALEDPAQECCQYVGQALFYHFVAAELGLPRAHLPFGDDVGTGQGERFQVRADSARRGFSASRPMGATRNEQVWEHELENLAGDDCDPLEPIARHCSLFEVPHRVVVGWEYPSTCSAGSGFRGDVVHNPGASDDCGRPGDPLYEV